MREIHRFYQLICRCKFFCDGIKRLNALRCANPDGVVPRVCKHAVQ